MPQWFYIQILDMYSQQLVVYIQILDVYSRHISLRKFCTKGSMPFSKTILICHWGVCWFLCPNSRAIALSNLPGGGKDPVKISSRIEWNDFGIGMASMTFFYRGGQHQQQDKVIEHNLKRSPARKWGWDSQVLLATLTQPDGYGIPFTLLSKWFTTNYYMKL